MCVLILLILITAEGVKIKPKVISIGYCLTPECPSTQASKENLNASSNGINESKNKVEVPVPKLQSSSPEVLQPDLPERSVASPFDFPTPTARVLKSPQPATKAKSQAKSHSTNDIKEEMSHFQAAYEQLGPEPDNKIKLKTIKKGFKSAGDRAVVSRLTRKTAPPVASIPNQTKSAKNENTELPSSTDEPDPPEESLQRMTDAARGVLVKPAVPIEMSLSLEDSELLSRIASPSSSVMAIEDGEEDYRLSSVDLFSQG